jgi:hypothetical protein
VYADPGYNCAGEPIAEGCTNPLACNYDNTATLDDGSCDFLETTTVATGAETVWLVGLTLTGTAFEAFAGPCEASGGVNPNVSINGVIVGDGSAPLTMDGITDPTGLLAELAALAATVEFGICGDNITVSALGNIIPMVGNGTFWQSPIPVNEDGQYLWAAPLMNFNIGCNDVNANNFTAACDLSLACTYDVTLRVNMANETVSAQGVHIAGDFQSWDPAATPVAQQAYGVYSITLSLPNGAYEYKFLNGNMWGEDEIISGACAAAGTTNRVVVVNQGDVTSDIPCFGSCEACLGCTDPLFAEYDPFAGGDGGTCGSAAVSGCTYPDAENYNAQATTDDGSCVFNTANDCVADLDGDGSVATADLLAFLSFFGSTCL